MHLEPSYKYFCDGDLFHIFYTPPKLNQAPLCRRRSRRGAPAGGVLCFHFVLCVYVCESGFLLIPSSSSSFSSTTSFSFIYPTVSSEIYSQNLRCDGLNFHNRRVKIEAITA